MITIVAPKAELVEAGRVVDGIIVVPEGTDLVSMDADETNASIMMREDAIAFGGLGSGFINESKRVYFQNGSVSALRKLVTMFKLKAGGNLPGYKLIVKESFAPESANHEPKVYPANSPYAGQYITSEGAQIYRSIKLLPLASPEGDTILKIDKLGVQAAEVSAEVFENEGEA